MSATRDAAVILVGNELLSGRIADRNLAPIARALWQRGIPLRACAVVRDEVDEIARWVRGFASERTWVVTAGGIGPTHDDVTLAGVAAAFGLVLAENPTLAGLLAQHFGERLTPAHLRMARAPEGSTLVGGDDGHWPTVCCRNVFILPGVPEFLRHHLARLLPVLGAAAPFVRLELVLRADEALVAPLLDAAAAAHPAVEIGSYPAGETVLVTFEGSDPQAVAAAHAVVDAGTAGIPRG